MEGGVMAKKTSKVILTRIPDGTYFISVLDEETGARLEPPYGPFPRNEVFNQLVTLGVPGDDARERLIDEADLKRSAQVGGIPYRGPETQ